MGIFAHSVPNHPKEVELVHLAFIVPLHFWLQLVTLGIIVQEMPTHFRCPVFLDHIAELEVKVSVIYVRLVISALVGGEVSLSYVKQGMFVMSQVYLLQKNLVLLGITVTKEQVQMIHRVTPENHLYHVRTGFSAYMV